MTKHRSGVTLLELLVVIGVVILISALIIPAALKTRNSARNAECLNNLRQMALGFRLYADMNQDRFPDANGESWFLQIAPYLEMQEAVFYCPGNPVSSDLGYDWRDDMAVLPNAMLSKKKIGQVAKSEIILVFDRVFEWHAPGTVNAAMVNGSARSFSQQDFEENMQYDVTTGEFLLGF